MSVYVPSLNETDPKKIVRSLRELAQGRSNGVGTVTLAAGATSTTVIDQNCAAGSHIGLTPQTADASAALATTYIATSNGSFTLTHANNSQTDRTFTYAIVG
jgi:hypothetical protein